MELSVNKKPGLKLPRTKLPWPAYLFVLSIDCIGVQSLMRRESTNDNDTDSLNSTRSPADITNYGPA